MSKRTITLTDRPPVTIEEDNWDVIAIASDNEHDGKVKSQANIESNWWIKVRQHDDGRAIVSASYSYRSNWQNARDYSAKRGIVLPATSDSAAIIAAIKEVCADIATAEHHGDEADRWPTLAAECIADLPAEELE